MNIFRWKRKSKKKIKLKTLMLFIFSLIMTTFAWFAYSKVLSPTLNIHMASWDMEYYIGTDKKTNPISIDISSLYPAMEEQTVIIDIFNNGETLVDIGYQVQSVTIAGTAYEIVQENGTNTTENYIELASSVLTTDETTGEEIYQNVITNDITRFPFTIEIEHSAQVEEVTEDAYGNSVPGEGYLKLTVDWIGDNNVLDSDWGYIVGEYFANNPTATSAMSIVLSIDSYQVDPDAEALTSTLPSTTETKPFLPTGFSKVAGTNLDVGLVIKDSLGNEYVWVEVPKSASIYTTAGLNITTFSDDEYSAIETDLQTYVGDYLTRADEHTHFDAIGLSPTNYATLKNKMLKSIYENGGFYIGRYETGIEDEYRTRPTSTAPTQTPVIKANAYPYNYVTCAQAHTIATTKIDAGDYTTSLMFGLQWDLTMKYLETKGTSQAMLKTDSTIWGNYSNSAYSLIIENAKYMTANTWLTAPYEKESGVQALLGSGGNSGLCQQNIYDLAGNLTEWTYNMYIDTDYSYRGGNGGDYLSEGTKAAACCGSYDSTVGVKNIGFRITMY